jgi:hypothetical protein
LVRHREGRGRDGEGTGRDGRWGEIRREGEKERRREGGREIGRKTSVRK